MISKEEASRVVQEYAKKIAAYEAEGNWYWSESDLTDPITEYNDLVDLYFTGVGNTEDIPAEDEELLTVEFRKIVTAGIEQQESEFEADLLQWKERLLAGEAPPKDDGTWKSGEFRRRLKAACPWVNFPE